MTIAIVAVVAFVAGAVLALLFGARVVSKVKAELLAVETRLTTAIKTAASKLP